jgi:hypothetical protein
MCDPISDVFGDASDDHAGIAVPDERHARKLMTIQQANDVANVSIQRYGVRQIRSAFLRTRKGCDEHVSACLLQ